MTAGTPPIRARKLRYYETDQLTERASEPAPKTSVGRSQVPPPHDWVGVTASVDERLTQTLLRRREAENKARPGGGKDQAPQLPTQAKPKAPADEREPNAPDHDAEAPDVPMAKAPAAITRAQGLDRTTDLDLFDR